MTTGGQLERENERLKADIADMRREITTLKGELYELLKGNRDKLKRGSASRWQFTIRDWLWLSIVVGLVIGWRLHYEKFVSNSAEAEDKNAAARSRIGGIKRIMRLLGPTTIGCTVSLSIRDSARCKNHRGAAEEIEDDGRPSREKCTVRSSLLLVLTQRPMPEQCLSFGD